MKKLSINYFKKTVEIAPDKNAGYEGGSGIKYSSNAQRKKFSEVDLWNIHRRKKTAMKKRRSF